MQTPKISVLMPAYNAEKYICEAIESILNQTFTDFEFIIIDDCSTDNTLDIIKRYAEKDSRIIVFKNEKNLGISRTRNKLIFLSKAEYLVWQDADDISLPYRIENQYDFMEKNPEVGICGGYLQFFDGKKYLRIRKYHANDVDLRRNIFKFSPVSQGVSIIRKEIIDTVGCYDINLNQAEDLDMSFRIGTISKFSNIQKILLLCRFHQSSISNKKIKKNIDDTLFVRNRAAKMYDYRIIISDRLGFVVARFVKILPASLIFKFFNYLRTI